MELNRWRFYAQNTLDSILTILKKKVRKRATLLFIQAYIPYTFFYHALFLFAFHLLIISYVHQLFYAIHTILNSFAEIQHTLIIFMLNKERNELSEQTVDRRQ